MDGILATPTAMGLSPPISLRTSDCSKPRCHFPGKHPSPILTLQTGHFFYLPVSVYSNFSDQFIRQQHRSRTSRLSVRSSSSAVGNAEYTEEPATDVKFQRTVTLPGCLSPLSLFGTGHREKTFAIIGVKVYAAGLYINESILSGLRAWKGRSAVEIQKDSSLFSSIFQAPAEKALQIVLVRDVDGKIFWDALDEAISPRIKSPSSEDKSALSTFRSIFQGRPLNKGTLIFLTWLHPLKMLVCVSSEGFPTSVDATIESKNVTSSLFDVFFGDSPVSPTLKSSVVNQLVTLLR